MNEASQDTAAPTSLEAFRLDRLALARHLLEEARSVPEVKQVRDMAEALRHYAQQQGESLAIQNDAAEIKLRAERKAGALVSTLTGGHGGRKSLHDARISLQDAGIDYYQSHRWQRIAALPDPDFETYIAETRARQQELTSAGALKLSRLLQTTADIQTRQAATTTWTETTHGAFYTDMERLAQTGQRFACIYADPPWAYSNQGTRASTHHHYATMTVAEICALPIGALAADNCHLHLWTTNAFLFDCPQIFAAWGFQFKSSFVWVKPQMGIGNYWRNSHELLLLAVRGTLTAQHRGLQSWLQADRTTHSAKPAAIRDRIEALSPGPYLELFGRERTPGWVTWGNECYPSNGRLFKSIGL